MSLSGAPARVFKCTSQSWTAVRIYRNFYGTMMTFLHQRKKDSVAQPIKTVCWAIEARMIMLVDTLETVLEFTI